MKVSNPQQYQEYMQRLSGYQQQNQQYNRDLLTSPDFIPSGAEQSNYLSGELLLPIDLSSSVGQFNDLYESAGQTFNYLKDGWSFTDDQRRLFDIGLSKTSGSLTGLGDNARAASTEAYGGFTNLGLAIDQTKASVNGYGVEAASVFRGQQAEMQSHLYGPVEEMITAYAETLPQSMTVMRQQHGLVMQDAKGDSKTAFSYMGTYAQNFFNNVGYQASSVLGGLVTGEINSLDDAWDILVDGMGSSFENMLSSLTKSLIDWGANSLLDLAGSGFQDILAGVFNIGNGGNLSNSFSNILGSLFNGGGSQGTGGGLAGSLLSYGSDKLLSKAGGYLGEMAIDALGSVSTTLTEYAMSQAAQNVGAQLGQNVTMAQWSAIDQAGTAPVTSLREGSEFISSIGGSTGLMAAGTGLMAFDALVRFMPGGDPEGVMGGLKKTIGAAFGLYDLDSLTAEQAALKAESTQDYYSRLAGLDGSSFLSSDVAETGWDLDVYGGVMGLSSEEMDLVNLGLTGINEQLDELALNIEEAARLGDEELVQSLESQREELLAQGEQLVAINEQYGISVEGLGLQNAAMLELSTASEQMAISLNNLSLAYENSHDHKMDEAAATSDLVGYYQELAAQVEEISEGSVVLGDEADELVGKFLAGQVGAEQFAQSMQEKLLEAMRSAQQEGTLLAEQMNAIAAAIRDIPTEWSSTVVTSYESYGQTPEYSHSGGLILHSGGRAASPLARIYGGMTRYHSGAYVSRLARDEIPAVLQRGEFVVRRDAVTAATLPGLQAMNAGGSAANAYGGDIHIHGPLVQIDGNYLGDEDSKEDLVREIETKLRSLANSRFKS